MTTRQRAAMWAMLIIGYGALTACVWKIVQLYQS